MKHIKYLLIILLFGCSGSVNSPEVEIVVEHPKFEIKEWCTIASRNRASSEWPGLSGLQQGHSILNRDSDLKIEYTVHLRGARAHSDAQTQIPLEDSPLLISTEGLVSKDITPNCDPVNIIRKWSSACRRGSFWHCFCTT